MIYRETYIITSDKTSVKWLKIFHLYKGFKRKVSCESFFIKGSARKVKPPKLEYKGFKRRYIKKGDICRGLIIQTKYNHNLYGFCVGAKQINSLIIMRKKTVTFSKYFYGLSSKYLLRKKYRLLFNNAF